MRRALICGSLLFVLAGCGGGSSSPKPTPVPVAGGKYFKDPNFGFSFRYPTSWSVPAKGGRQEQIGGVNTYVLDFHLPTNTTSVQITLDSDVIQFPAFVDGKISRDPNGPSNFFHYYHRKVSGLPAMRVERWHNGQPDEIDTFVNTRTRSFDIRTNTAYPPFSSQASAGYEMIVRTMRVPFS